MIWSFLFAFLVGMNKLKNEEPHAFIVGFYKFDNVSVWFNDLLTDRSTDWSTDRCVLSVGGWPINQLSDRRVDGRINKFKDVGRFTDFLQSSG